ncbi:MAG: hypothetical protein AB7G28_24575 [Pirellulales bacterium]
MTTDATTPTNEKSGKMLIFGVLLLGLAMAAAAWWFRYSTTHRAVELWGAQGAVLIRDAPRVTLRSGAASQDAEGTSEPDVARDISKAGGLTHLRNALLEDSSYDWTAKGPADSNWGKSLVFERSEGAEPRLVILFSPDFKWAANGTAADPAKSAIATSGEFAAGLGKFFAEQDADAPAEE